MRLFFLLIAIISVGTASAQELNRRKSLIWPQNRDHGMKVFYADTTHGSQKTAWFVDGRFAGNPRWIFDPGITDSLSVIGKPVKIDGIEYVRQIHVKTKEGTELKLVSLADLKSKYIKSGSGPVLFMVDGELIKDDYDKYKIDESYIARIFIDHMKSTKENIDLGIIKILTKSKRNNRDIIIRGTEVAKSRYN